MNIVSIMGRLTSDPEARFTAEGLCVAKYTVAVNRPTKEKAADFIPVTAFGKAGEFAEKFFFKGMRVALTGNIQTGSYTNKEGKKVYTWTVVAVNQEFAEDKKIDALTPEPKPVEEGFMEIPVGIDEELPFN